MSERNAIAVLSNNQGYVKFHQCSPEDDVAVLFNFKGFGPLETHAIHIHELGNTLNGCESLGPHFNPHETTHGSITIPRRPRHAGDLINNFTTDKDGKFTYGYRDELISLDPCDISCIIGRSIVIHSGVDDLGLGTGSLQKSSLENGNAGSRINCAVIGFASDLVLHMGDLVYMV